MGLLPFLAKHYGNQWSGAWTIEALQTPDHQLVNDYLNKLLAGDQEGAMAAFWRIKPAYDALFGLMAPMLPMGVHPFTQLKYYQWCTGGNGGLLRQPLDPNEAKFPLNASERKHIRDSYGLIGITPTSDPDECFVVGRAAYANGVRAADMPVKPTYQD
jgi:4-hydroxy-tetrahydrodipicolinate synthase